MVSPKKQNTSKNSNDGSAEIEAIGVVYSALRDLERAAQLRVLSYAAQMLNLSSTTLEPLSQPLNNESQHIAAESVLEVSNSPDSDTLSLDETEGISTVALKWMKRSGLDAKSLQSLFSLGIDEIDLVAKAVPGASKKDRMRSVLLLKGIAAYLGSGAARVTYEQLKEACLHYNAYDATNFASYLKSFSAEVGGSKEAGYTLTARGLTNATDLVRTQLGGK